MSGFLTRSPAIQSTIRARVYRRGIGSSAPGRSFRLRRSFVFFFGPSLEFFPSVNLALDLSRYELNPLRSLGAKAGARLRISLLWNRLAAEAQAYAIAPLTANNLPAGGSLALSQTRSLGLNLTADARIPGTRTIIGGGLFLAYLNLASNAPEYPTLGRTTVIARSMLATFRWNF